MQFFCPGNKKAPAEGTGGNKRNKEGRTNAAEHKETAQHSAPGDARARLRRALGHMDGPRAGAWDVRCAGTRHASTVQRAHRGLRVQGGMARGDARHTRWDYTRQAIGRPSGACGGGPIRGACPGPARRRRRNAGAMRRGVPPVMNGGCTSHALDIRVARMAHTSERSYTDLPPVPARSRVINRSCIPLIRDTGRSWFLLSSGCGRNRYYRGAHGTGLIPNET